MEGQIEIFSELVQELPSLPKFEPTTTCANCEHIIAVHFANSNLFFCTKQKGGRYGKKIKKSAPNCWQFEHAIEELISCGDGYYGGFRNGVKR